MLRYLRSRLAASDGGRTQTLYVFANPLGNAVGDTVIATQHVQFLLGIPRNDLTVWTANSDIWRALAPGTARITSLISSDQLKAFHIIFFDWVNAGPHLLEEVASCGALVLYWKNRNDLEVLCRGEVFAKVSLPPTINHPERIQELYDALGWTKVTGLLEISREYERRSGIYYNPYASTPNKSIGADLACLLAETLVRVAPAGVPIALGPPPCPLSAQDAHGFNKINEAIQSNLATAKLRNGRYSIQEYIDIVSTSYGVVCPDTSTQHVAAATRTPCIVLYAAGRAFNHYAFGWPGAESYAIAMYRSDGAKESVTTIVGLLLSCFCGIDLLEKENYSGLNLAINYLKDFFSEQAERPLFDERTRLRAASLLLTVSKQIPPKWSACLLPELQQVVSEICDPAVLDRINVISLRRRTQNDLFAENYRKTCGATAALIQTGPFCSRQDHLQMII